MRDPMKNHLFLAGQMIVFLFLCASCSSLHTYHFGVQNRAAMVPDDFGETEVAIAHAEQSQGAQYCPDKIDKAKELARQGAEVYWTCHNTESSRLLTEARKLAGEAEGCWSQGAAVAPPMALIEPIPAAEPTPERMKYCVSLDIEFDINKSDIRPQYHDEVAKVGDFMKKYPTTTAVIEGHTDNVGGSEHNMKLSQRRAESVVNYLAGKFAIDRSRLSAKGYGSTRAIAYNNTAEGRQQNRRINAIIDCVVEK
jgi:OmpA-OmpF porin, OOP family